MSITTEIKELNCCLCQKKVGEMIKGGLKRSAKIVCNECWDGVSNNVYETLKNRMYKSIKPDLDDPNDFMRNFNDILRGKQ